MSGNEEFSAIVCHHDTDAALLGFSNEAQPVVIQNILFPYLRMPAVWHEEDVVKPSENG